MQASEQIQPAAGLAAPARTGVSPVLSVRDLRVFYAAGREKQEVVRGIDLDLLPGETLGVVGESGSGKTSAILGMVGLLPRNASVGGSVVFDDRDLVAASARDRRGILGAQIGVVYQDALRSLNPVMRIGRQLEELLQAHHEPGDHTARVVDMLASVGLPNPRARARQYPHELSGGMRQRTLIALGLGLGPKLLIADEPTTAVDVTIQAQILELIQRLAHRSGTATILVTHDMGVVANMCDRVAVMYAGSIVEQGRTDEVFLSPKHPYTALLLRSMPRMDSTRGSRYAVIPGKPLEVFDESPGCPFAPRCYAAVDKCREQTPPLLAVAGEQLSACWRTQDDGALPALPEPEPAAPTAPRPRAESDPLVAITGLHRAFTFHGGFLHPKEPPVRAVDGIDLTLYRRESLGLVGESGSGKSTLGRMLAGLERPNTGSIVVDGMDIVKLSGSRLRAYRRSAQLIYQDPRSSVNRRMSISATLQDALARAGVPAFQRHRRVKELLGLVGLPDAYGARYPHELSGGEAQRAAIARALAVSPKLIIADEAVSSLDVSIKGQILNMLADLRDELGLTVVFISHDLGVVRQVCDRVGVMYLGKIVEIGTTEAIFDSPSHPYTLALRSAIPIPDPVRERRRSRIVLTGDTPNPAKPPAGCRFHPRCPIGPTFRPERQICIQAAPELVAGRAPGQLSACHFADEVGAYRTGAA